MWSKSSECNTSFIVVFEFNMNHYKECANKKGIYKSLNKTPTTEDGYPKHLVYLFHTDVEYVSMFCGCHTLSLKFKFFSIPMQFVAFKYSVCKIEASWDNFIKWYSHLHRIHLNWIAIVYPQWFMMKSKHYVKNRWVHSYVLIKISP